MKSRTDFATVTFAVSLAIVAGTANFVRAGLGCCAHCGQTEDCQKICRLVTETKKVTTTCWGYQCEDFCDPCPSEPGCQHCETVCDESHDPKAPCVHLRRFVWTEWQPTGTRRIYTKKKLMKKTITKTIPSYKWVVESCCQQCQTNLTVPEMTSGTQLPPLPRGIKKSGIKTIRVAQTSEQSPSP